MDIRVQAYGPATRPVSVTRFSSGTQNTGASSMVVQPAAQRGPVTAVAQVSTPARQAAAPMPIQVQTQAQKDATRQLMAQVTGTGQVLDTYI